MTFVEAASLQLLRRTFAGQQQLAQQQMSQQLAPQQMSQQLAQQQQDNA